MKRQIRLLATVLTVALMLAPLPVSAQGAMHVTGGGTGTFGADLDSDGEIDGSQFGMALVIQGSTARGHFECLMAGRSDILGLPLMAVEGQVDGATANPDGSVSFSGTARVNLANGQIFEGVLFSVLVTAGGPATGTLQLTVIGAFDGVPGDTIPGNGNYDLPPETVNSGQIKFH
jgi:hypothetical protein